MGAARDMPASKPPFSRAAPFYALACGAVLGCVAEAPKVEGADAPAEIPEGAVQVGPDDYRAPIGPDAEGCMMWRAVSRFGGALQVVYYRRADGSFSPVRAEADCPAGEPGGGA